MNTPKIRFKGFKDDWEQRKLGELGEIMTGSTPSTSKPEYYSENGIPWVTPTDIDALTISDTPRKLSEEGIKVGRVVPANTILCTCIASIGKNALLMVKGSFNQQINSLTPSAENDSYFLLTESELWSEKMKRMAASGTMQIVNKTEFSELVTMVPSLDEQKIIGFYFRNIDNLITLHQRKCDETKKLKKFMLQKMFPKKDAKKPEIRFAGFTDDWEQRKLVDVVDVRSGRDYKHLEEGDIPVYGTGGYMLSVNEALSDDEDAIGIGRKGTIDNPYILRAPFWTVDTLFYAVPRDKYDLNFVFDIFQNVNWKAKDESTGVPSLSKATINAVETLMPEYAEQKKIGEYFSYLDNFITLHQRKCDELKEFKKYMLQNMFPQKG